MTSELMAVTRELSSEELSAQKVVHQELHDAWLHTVTEATEEAQRRRRIELARPSPPQKKIQVERVMSPVVERSHHVGCEGCHTVPRALTKAELLQEKDVRGRAMKRKTWRDLYHQVPIDLLPHVHKRLEKEKEFKLPTKKSFAQDIFKSRLGKVGGSGWVKSYFCSPDHPLDSGRKTGVKCVDFSPRTWELDKRPASCTPVL